MGEEPRTDSAYPILNDSEYILQRFPLRLSRDRDSIYVPLRFAPVQNALLSPVTIPALSPASPSGHFQTRSSSACPSMLVQLSCFGRLRVTSSMFAAGWDRTACFVGGELLENLRV